jgi:hypothetical protein
MLPSSPRQSPVFSRSQYMHEDGEAVINAVIILITGRKWRLTILYPNGG